MSDDPGVSIQSSSSRALDSQVAELVKVESRRRRLMVEYKKTKAELTSMQAELAALRAKPPDPTVEQLRSELLEIKHRKVFDRLASEAGVNPGAVDNLWKTSGYKIDQHSDIIPEDSIKALISDQKKAQPYLFQATGDGAVQEPVKGNAESEIKPGPGNTRGNLVRDTGKFQVRRRGPGSVRDPLWMQVNQKAYSEAEKNGNVEWID